LSSGFEFEGSYHELAAILIGTSNSPHWCISTRGFSFQADHARCKNATTTPNEFSNGRFAPSQDSPEGDLTDARPL
jgi:hypothetical protein